MINMGIAAIILCSILVIPGGVRAYTDITLRGSEYMRISGVATCDNLSIADEATLVVENAYLQINGIVRMSDWARLFIRRSTVVVSPPALDDNIIVVHVEDNSLIRVTNSSNLILKPQPNPTNISYMLLEDNSDLLIQDSTFHGEHPDILNQSIELASVTAGVYLLSGYASWHMIDSDITGRLGMDGKDLTGRWFWCTLHQRSSMKIHNCDIGLISNSALFTLLKPVSGKTTITDSRILGGRLDAEVAAEVVLHNSSFLGKVDFKDQTDAKVTGCTFGKYVVVGSTLSVGDLTHEPETTVSIENSVFEDELNCEGNSTTKIENSTFKGIKIKENAIMHLTDCSVEKYTSIMDHSTAVFQRSTFTDFVIDDTATVHLDDVGDITNMTFYGNNELRDGETLNLHDGNVKDITLYDGYTGGFSLENVEVTNLGLENNINASFECKNTSLDAINLWWSGENVTLDFVVIDSSIPDLSLLDSNVSSQINHRLEVVVEMNGQGVEAEVVIEDDSGRDWRGTAQSGRISFDLPYRFIGKTQKTVADYTVTAEYLGFFGEKELELTSSKTVTFDFTDSSPPVISNISHTVISWNMGKEMIVRANCRDHGCGVLKSISLVYRTDGGEWTEIRMFRIGPDLYEATIPKQTESRSVTYYIAAEDSAENNGKTPQREVTLGRDRTVMYSVVVIILLSIIVLAAVRKALSVRRVRKYSNKYRSRL